MADEAEETVEEVGVDAALAEMQQMLDAAPEVEEVDETKQVEETETTEQAEGDDDPAEGEAVETDAADEADEVVDEGPSFLMKQEAVRAGIDPAIVGRAQDDAQLQLLIEAVTRPEPKDAAPAKDRTLKVELPEDEFGPDDPIRKAFVSLQGQLNEQREEYEQALAALTTFANGQLDREDQQRWQSLYEPFDKALDSFESPLLGTSGKLSDKQKAERAMVAEKYVALGATEDMPAAEKARYAELALAAVRKDLVEQRTKKQQAAARQQKQVTGGGGPQRTVSLTKSREDILAEWDKSLTRGVPLPN